MITTHPHSWIWNDQSVSLPTDNGNEIAHLIRTHQAISISDGSYKNNLSTCAWNIQGTRTTFEGSTIVPVTSIYEHDAFCSELCGLLCQIVTVLLVCSFHAITEGTILICCDNYEALYQAFHLSFEQRYTHQHADILLSIHDHLQKCPIHTIPYWVKGHLDKTIPFEQLHPLSQLNVIVDAKAKELRKRIASTYCPTYHILHPYFQIQHNTHFISSPYVNSLYSSIYCQKND